VPHRLKTREDANSVLCPETDIDGVSAPASPRTRQHRQPADRRLSSDDHQMHHPKTSPNTRGCALYLQTGCKVITTNGAKGRHNARTLGIGLGTARAKYATRWWVQWTRHLASEYLVPTRRTRV
jgi:hypothetical protein